jgi:hypothetical protein
VKRFSLVLPNRETKRTISRVRSQITATADTDASPTPVVNVARSPCGAEVSFAVVAVANHAERSLLDCINQEADAS